MKQNKARLALSGVIGLWLSLATAGISAEQSERPFLHPLFSDHVVLQRHVKVPVWGWASPGSKITVTFGGQTKVATAGTDGKWSVRLDKMEVSAEPRILTVIGSDQSVSVKDVLVGDVWLCSGQSNMEMGIGACNATTDIAQADFPGIDSFPGGGGNRPMPLVTLQLGNGVARFVGRLLGRRIFLRKGTVPTIKDPDWIDS